MAKWKFMSITANFNIHNSNNFLLENRNNALKLA